MDSNRRMCRNSTHGFCPEAVGSFPELVLTNWLAGSSAVPQTEDLYNKHFIY
jgi:hypothetical protein